MDTAKTREQPSGQNWGFIKELRAFLHKKTLGERSKKGKGEVSLQNGVNLDFRFPDKGGLLQTSYADFKRFLRAEGIPLRGNYIIKVEKAKTDVSESYRLEVREDHCKLTANDTEGIRRGLVFLEDEILRTCGPFLKKGVTERKPFIKTRISRCFFGPIKRPPMNRDELADNVDYYPDEYLNRLTHEGINGLWLTIQFSDLCPSKFFPSHGKDFKKRLDKLRKTVEKCRRYGIKIYLFCIEPKGFGSIPEYLLPDSELKRNQCFAGHKEMDVTYFCTSSREGIEYIEECTYHIFSSVPGLGGLIDINLEERPTHCYSSTTLFLNNNCPRCSKRKPWEVFADTTGALARGMQKANSDAEMISWLYVPYLYGKEEEDIEKTKKTIAGIAAHIPDNVVLQYNFESTGKALQLGKERVLLDYWLAWPGPSDIFTDCAKNAVKNGARASAKIQVGCSHEVATVPFVPVPGNLYEKYSAMRKLKVSSVMQCWYFGNYPGLMNKAAGELCFEPFPLTEDDFLLKLASIDWGENAEKVVKAWKYFSKGYSDFPYNLSFTWYGPLHNSVVWPLYLNPADKPISPSWKFTFPLESGDRIGECICYDHTLEETLILLKNMSKNWARGVKIFEGIEPQYARNYERKGDIALARALCIQIGSAYNVFRFYALREKLPYSGYSGKKKILKQMKSIVENEIKNSMELRKICIKDPRLGFHSEAEGYKYHPEKLKWRADLLKNLLIEEFPAIEQAIEDREPLFPEYTGEEPAGPVYNCFLNKDEAPWKKLNDKQTKWRSWHDRDSIYFEVECQVKGANSVSIKMEPCRLWPAQTFTASADGKTQHNNFKSVGDNRWSADGSSSGKKWKVDISIPFAIFEGYYKQGRPMRVNIIRGDASWIKLNPWEYRLRLDIDSPVDLGWVFFE